MATDTALHPELWSAIAEQGWLGLHLSETCGGLGLTAVELAVVAEEMGRACFPGPFLGSVWAGALIAEANPKSPLLEKLAAGETRGAVALVEPETGWNPTEVTLNATSSADGFKLSGRKSFVSDAGVADTIVCVARGRRPGAVCRACQSQGPENRRDPRPRRHAGKLYDVLFEDVNVGGAELLAIGPPAAKALARSLDIVGLCAAADMLGGMQWILEDAVEYAKTRQQFGKVIGSFQAVQHMAADMLLWTESTRSAVYYAAWTLDHEPENSSRFVSIAKAYVSDGSREVANRGVQVHGGIGFTWEHDLQLYYKRLEGFGNPVRRRRVSPGPAGRNGARRLKIRPANGDPPGAGVASGTERQRVA